MERRHRPEPAILRTRLARGPDGRLRVVPYDTDQEPPLQAVFRMQSRPSSPAEPATKPKRLDRPANIDITIRLPKAHLPKLLRQQLSILFRQFRPLPRTMYVLTGIIFATLVLLILHDHMFVAAGADTSKVPGAVRGTHTIAGPIQGTPSFTTLLPSGKSIQSLGGWYRISPPTSNPVYAFADIVGSVGLDVSEQPLPSSWQQDSAEQAANLAQGFGANEKLSDGNLAIYIGTSSKGPQSVIFTEDNLLILIKSTDGLTINQWVAYINSLH